MKYVLGLDLSTQSLSACVYDINNFQIINEYSLSYNSLPEIENSSMDKETLLIPNSEGQAEQDPYIFITALEKVFQQLQKRIDLSKIQGIQISAQQHGHVFLNNHYPETLQRLDKNNNLWECLKNCFSYPSVPIWRTADTAQEADFLRKSVGGKEQMIILTGSDSPLRFTGAVIKKIFTKNPEVQQNTHSIQLLNTFLASILTGNADCAVDWGNASGMSLMDYEQKCWHKPLLKAIDNKLESLLGKLASPLSIAGVINDYFVQKYHFSPHCTIGIGTGDNPATKVLCEGDLLSLGTSFVYMKEIKPSQRDSTGVSNAMYDGLGKAFMILCRTNGALVWDKIRALYHKNYREAHQALVQQKENTPLVLWQPETESVPLSRNFDLVGKNNFEEDYKGILLSSLGLLALCTEKMGTSSSVLSITGGATVDKEIVQIIANLWGVPVRVLPSVGAALGVAFMAGVMIDSDFSLQKAQQSLGEHLIYPEQSSNMQEYKKRLLAAMKNLMGNTWHL